MMTLPFSGIFIPPSPPLIGLPLANIDRFISNLGFPISLCHTSDCFPALQMHSDWVRDVAWAPNLGLPKSTIASASQDGTVVIWTVGKEGDQWEGKFLNNFHTPMWRASWSLTGNILAVADGSNNVTLWKEAMDGQWQQVQSAVDMVFLLANGHACSCYTKGKLSVH